MCNGVEVMRVGGTKPQYNVDIYSGNHPFYLGNRSSMIVDEGQLNRWAAGSLPVFCQGRAHSLLMPSSCWGGSAWVGHVGGPCAAAPPPFVVGDNVLRQTLAYYVSFVGELVWCALLWPWDGGMWIASSDGVPG